MNGQMKVYNDPTLSLLYFKGLQHEIPKNNYRLNDTVIVFVIVLYRFLWLVKKIVTADPYFTYRSIQCMLR